MSPTPATFRAYVQSVVDKVGSDLAVGKFLGFADGSRVGQWKKGADRASELACIKLARWMGDDPLFVLRLAGYEEMASLLDGSVNYETADIANAHNQLVELKRLIDNAVSNVETKQQLSAARVSKRAKAKA